MTPPNDVNGQLPRKKKKKAFKGLLSFGGDEGEEGPKPTSVQRSGHLQDAIESATDQSRAGSDEPSASCRLRPNPRAAVPAPKLLTKATLQAEAVARDTLRREFLALQEAVKATEILIPFVFYDGTNVPGGTVKVKKGDHIWLFLERCRKVGAVTGVSSNGRGKSVNGSKSRRENKKEWARVGVDDLMCVRGEVIIPHVSITCSY